MLEGVEQGPAVKTDTSLIYQDLWKDIIYAIDPQTNRNFGLSDPKLPFVDSHVWNERSLKMQVMRINNTGEEKTWLTFGRRLDKVCLHPEPAYGASWDTEMEETISPADYKKLLRFAVQVFTLSNERLVEYRNSKNDYELLEKLSAQDLDTQKALWNLEHMTELREADLLRTEEG